MTDRDILPIGGPDHDPDHDEIAARVAALYAATPSVDADQVERTVRAVRARSMHQPVRSRLGIIGPRWWWGAAAAAVLITATTRPWRGSLATREADSACASAADMAVRAAAAESLGSSSAAVAAVAPRGSVTRVGGSNVEFDIQLPAAATKVAIVGDFNDWDQTATPMAKRAADGTWSARVPLPPGRHTYAFVIDGERWIVDPLAPQVPGDGYGPANAVVIEAPSR
ncbi:MAG: isoamylase early set domain-containing protein [Gemmatimonadaceae bacterium]|nr:isoamylase early set domain-containing protein [Gemmatimonadaceae bacterium]